MTAEIGILNRMGVALAADSAVTIGTSGLQKVYNSANKLFSLSKHHPVGIMIYGSAQFMGVPWETIIKSYRKELGTEKFDTLEEYCGSFFDFLKSYYNLTSHYAESQQVKIVFNSYLSEILNQVDRDVRELSEETGPSEEEVRQLLEDKVVQLINIFNEYPLVRGFTNDFIAEFVSKHSEAIVEVLDANIFIDLDDNFINQVILLAAQMFSREVISDAFSGIVIAGYGENEIFPSLYEYQLEGLFCGFLKYKLGTTSVIDSEASEEKTTASIRSFAQREMVYAFMQGIDPNIQRAIVDGLQRTLINDYPSLVEEILEIKLTEEQRGKLENLGSAFADEFDNEIRRIQVENHVNPIIDIVDLLPKEELAEMAEALVNLTSFKRKVTIDAETVGGPIDVAVISKADGFIWIKRKHYFKPELNYHFFQNYMRGEEE